MRRTFVALAALVVLLAKGASSADEPAKTFRVVGLSVVHKTSKAAGDPTDAFMAGTTIDLIVHKPGKRLLRIDVPASKLTLFADDRQTNLKKVDPLVDPFGWLIVHDRISADGTRHALQIRSPLVPAAGATQLHIQGALVLYAGSDEKTVEAKDLKLKPKRLTKVGPFDATLYMSTLAKTPGVQLTSSQPGLKSVVFLDSKGQVIPSEPPMTMAISLTKNTQNYSSMFQLKGDIEGGSIQIRYYSKVETLTEPFDLKIGVGF